MLWFTKGRGQGGWVGHKIQGFRVGEWSSCPGRSRGKHKTFTQKTGVCVPGVPLKGTGVLTQILVFLVPKLSAARRSPFDG